MVSRTSTKPAKIAKTAKRSTAKPDIAKPVATKSVTTKSVMAKRVTAKSGTARPNATKSPSAKTTAGKPALLSGGNPQIAKADGDAPVQAYIKAMPGWKSDAGRGLDALIVRTVPQVRKAVKWNSPFYGVEGQGWFLSFHCFAKYIKVAFFRGASLHPVPPVESKDRNVRYLHIHEEDELDERLVTSWIQQASELPGWMP